MQLMETPINARTFARRYDHRCAGRGGPSCDPQSSACSNFTTRSISGFALSITPLCRSDGIMWRRRSIHGIGVRRRISPRASDVFRRTGLWVSRKLLFYCREIVRTLVGSLGLIAAVPLTTAIAILFAQGLSRLGGGAVPIEGSGEGHVISFTDYDRIAYS